MRLARHEPPYGRHSPRCPVMGLAGHLALRAAAHPREGPRGRAHSWAAQDGYAPRGGTRASTFRENTNGSSGICVGCRIGKDAKLAAAALAQSLFSRPRERWSPGGAAGIPWRLSHSCHPTQCASQLASQLARSSRRNSVHECPKMAPRGRFRRSVYTPASPRLSTTAQQCTQMVQNSSKRPFSPICVHSLAPGGKPTPQVPAPGRRAIRPDSRDRAVSRVPRHRRPHGPRDAKALGPEAHATGTVTQPPTHTNSRSLLR